MMAVALSDGAAMAAGMAGDLKQMLLVALLNPAAIATGFLIGRRASEMPKILIGGFAAGLAGLAFVWLLDSLGVYIGNSESVGGIFSMSLLVGTLYAYIGFKTRR